MVTGVMVAWLIVGIITFAGIWWEGSGWYEERQRRHVKLEMRLEDLDRYRG